MSEALDHPEIRESVRRLCMQFPGDYWRWLDLARQYPSEFVAGCNGGACHAQMYTMGTLLRHGSDGQKPAYLPAIAAGTLRLQAFGVTEPESGSDTTSIETCARRQGDRHIVNGQKVWTNRAEHSDLPIRTMMNHGTAEFFFDDVPVSSWEAADVCVRTLGGFGFAEEYDVERKFRETRLYQVAPISTNLVLSYLAEHVLGLPRSY